jgi:hypothetical protein
MAMPTVLKRLLVLLALAAGAAAIGCAHTAAAMNATG